MLAGIFVSFFLILIGIFIFLAAEGEYRLVQSRKRQDGISVGQLMRTGFEVVSDTDTIHDVLALMARTGQEHFPVVRGAKIVGMLDRPSILRATARRDLQAAVTDYAISDFAMSTPADELATAEDLMVATGQMVLPVFEAGRLVGIVDDESIATCREYPIKKVVARPNKSFATYP